MHQVIQTRGAYRILATLALSTPASNMNSNTTDYRLNPRRGNELKITLVQLAAKAEKIQRSLTWKTRTIHLSTLINSMILSNWIPRSYGYGCVCSEIFSAGKTSEALLKQRWMVACFKAEIFSGMNSSRSVVTNYSVVWWREPVSVSLLIGTVEFRYLVGLNSISMCSQTEAGKK